MDETIHVAYCLNDGFAIPTCVSMASLLANTTSDVCFHVVSNRLSDENKSKLAQLGERFPHGRWIFHDLETDRYKDKFVLQKNIHVTVEVYYRLFLHEVIAGVDRLIYLDGDIIVCGDIKELWCENLYGKTLGAVKDIQLRPIDELNEILEFDVEKYYFNAGILLIDLAKFSKLVDLNTVFDVTEALHAKFSESRSKMTWYADQDVLNHIIRGDRNLTLLHARYNLQQNDFDQYTSWFAYAQNCSTLSEWTEANASPVIVHYTGAYKPWQLRNKFR
jgi:lipopolysaccharide biosynthesis glycosyltransferase